MFRGFKLKLDGRLDGFYAVGKERYKEDKIEFRKLLSQYMSDDGSISGSSMQEDWFPQIEADVFISHSHKNERRAIALAGFLYEEFQLSSFIDSCIWGHANDLLKLIDTAYCLNPGGKTYNYNLRNDSTSHVHMMLSTALSRMIDKTECLFILDTPDSISASEFRTETFSPWLFFEIGVTKTIQINIPDRLRDELVKEIRYFSLKESDTIMKSLLIRHEVDMSHLIKIDEESLIKWHSLIKKVRHKHSLDVLYGLVNNKENQPLND